MKKRLLVVVISFAITFQSFAQIELPLYSRIHNSCLKSFFEAGVKEVSVEKICNNYLFPCLQNNGIELESKSMDAIVTSFSEFKYYNNGDGDFLFKQLFEKYKLEKNKFSLSYTTGLDMILLEFHSIEKYFDENEEAYDNLIISKFELLRNEVLKIEKLNENEKTQLSITIDIAIGSAIFWHEKNENTLVHKANYVVGKKPATSVKRWWQYVGSFIGADILGAGVAMQLTYGVLPPQAYVAGGLVASAWDALNW